MGFEEFFKKNKINLKRIKTVLRNYDKDEEGNMMIKQGMFVVSRQSVMNYNFSDSWIFISQPGVLDRQGIAGKMALVKSYIVTKAPEHYSGYEKELAIANNFVMPEIAKQFQLEAAEYYNVVFEDCEELQKNENFKNYGGIKKQKIVPNKRYLLTPSFMNNNEELVHFGDILRYYSELRVSNMLEDIEKYLQRRHVPKTDIEKIKQDFIKQCIFHKFINFTDEHNLNSGILVSKDNEGIRARLAPCYDLDFATVIYNSISDANIPRTFLRKSDDGKFDLTSMLKQFKGDFEKDYLKEVIPKINIEEAIKTGEKYGNFTLSEKARNKYIEFFREQQLELVQFYKKEYKEKNKATEGR